VLLQGSFKMPSGTDKVYGFVSDPANVIQCVPGVENYAIGEGKRFSATVKVSFGFIRSFFQATGRVVKEDAVAHTATLELNGSGSGSSFSAMVDVSITGDDDSADLTWRADVGVHGPLGSLARPLLESYVKKTVDQMFGCVKTKLS
jgi:uncharacterized protein